MEHLLFFLVLLTCSLNYGNSKPLHQEILPHSRDYYAGYIKAITDNFDQLFPNERKVRSADEKEEQDEIESRHISDQTHFEEKRSTNEGANAGTDTKKKLEKKVLTEKKQNIELKTEDLDENEEEKATVSSEKPKNLGVETLKKDDVTKMEIADEYQTKVNDLESKDNIQEPTTDETADETAMENNQSELPEGNEDDDEIRRNFILEHADYGNAPVMPRIISGYQENPSTQSFDSSFIQQPVAFSSGPLPQPFGFGYGPSFFENIPFGRERGSAGETRSAIKRTGKKAHCPDSHHLNRVLVLPEHHCCGCSEGCEDVHSCGCCEDVHSCGCCDDVHSCGCCCNDHHNCGQHTALHDIHHWPVGCHEHYSHESPCLTYPHGNHVSYGFPETDCSCSCAPYHSHHPVILHPTYQECHHHNTHTIGTHHPCHVQHEHHHTNHVHHVYPHHCQNHCHNVGHHCQPDIQILPHYGHTQGGCHGWNPHWGY